MVRNDIERCVTPGHPPSHRSLGQLNGGRAEFLFDFEEVIVDLKFDVPPDQFFTEYGLACVLMSISSWRSRITVLRPLIGE